MLLMLTRVPAPQLVLTLAFGKAQQPRARAWGRMREHMHTHRPGGGWWLTAGHRPGAPWITASAHVSARTHAHVQTHNRTAAENLAAQALRAGGRSSGHKPVANSSTRHNDTAHFTAHKHECGSSRGSKPPCLDLVHKLWSPARTAHSTTTTAIAVPAGVPVNNRRPSPEHQSRPPPGPPQCVLHSGSGTSGSSDSGGGGGGRRGGGIRGGVPARRTAQGGGLRAQLERAGGRPVLPPPAPAAAGPAVRHADPPGARSTTTWQGQPSAGTVQAVGSSTPAEAWAPPRGAPLRHRVPAYLAAPGFRGKAPPPQSAGIPGSARLCWEE